MMTVDELVINTIGTLSELPDKEWEALLRFFLPSMVTSKPNDLVRILWGRARQRAGEGDPVRQYLLICQDLGLELHCRD